MKVGNATANKKFVVWWQIKNKFRGKIGVHNKIKNCVNVSTNTYQKARSFFNTLRSWLKKMNLFVSRVLKCKR